ncbi:MFS transporter [Nocardia sp. NPDC003963]
MASSVGGLVALTYGLIVAGEHSWSTVSAWIWIGAGVLVLVGFLFWEYLLGPERALVDMTLFRNASFTWGVVLTAVGVMAMVGVLFTLPQYFQAVAGTDAMGSGVRLLPLVGGLTVGALPADRIARRIGIKATVVIGFALLAAGSMIGARTGVDSGTAFVAAWTALTGAGLGLSMATAASAALCELSAEHSGVGSAVMQALQKTGGPLGTAVMGSVLSSGYQQRLALGGLPEPVVAQVEHSVFAGVSLADRTGSPQLLDSVRTAFAHGMSAALLVSSAMALGGLVLASVFLPTIEPAPAEAISTDRQSRPGLRYPAEDTRLRPDLPRYDEFPGPAEQRGRRTAPNRINRWRRS